MFMKNKMALLAINFKQFDVRVSMHR